MIQSIRARLSQASLFILLIAAPTVSAQMFSQSPLVKDAERSLTATYALIDFTSDSEDPNAARFNFDEPAYGVTFSRRNLLFSILVGSKAAATASEEDQQLIDASLITWNGIPLNRSGQTRIILPVAIFSNYRSVAGRETIGSPESDFRVTTLGIGTGLVLERVTQKAEFQARAMPVIALTLQQIGEGSGNARLLDTDVSIAFPRVLGNVGLTLGYGFRYHKWDVQASGLFQTITDETLDYTGSQHTFRFGINW